MVTRHTRTCPRYADKKARCRCTPSYQGRISNSGKILTKTFTSALEAKEWETLQARLKQQGKLVTRPKAPTLDEYAEMLLHKIETGALLNRHRERYKPSAARGLARAWRNHVSPILGHKRLDAVMFRDVQDCMDSLRASGYSPSTVRDSFKPLQVIFRTAMRDELVTHNPCKHIELDRAITRRERIATREEAAALLAALPESEQALWATAFYAGLRQGELMALRWSDVDMVANTITVRRGYDPVAQQFIAAKTRAGARTLGISQVLRPYLEAHRFRTGHGELVFPSRRKPTQPFTQTWACKLAKRAWDEAGLEPISMHECRHTFATMLIAAHANVKDVQAAMGHSNSDMTLDIYGHLFPGREQEVAALLDAYLNKHKP